MYTRAHATPLRILFISATILAATLWIHNINTDTAVGLFVFKKDAVILPASVEELQLLVRTAQAQKYHIAVVGADQSMGGQTISTDPRRFRVSLDKLNKLVALNIPEQEVTVQAGMTWRDLQILIAPHDLAIRAMQSYHDFSIGGSLSVNVHGQDIHDAPLIKTVKSFKLMMPDGNILQVSRTEHPELFGLALGGYGLFGIIIEVTLNLTHNTLLRRHTAVVSTDKLADYIQQHILTNPDIAFYSARFSVGDTDLFEKALVIYYTDTHEIAKERFKPFSLYQGIFSRFFLGFTKVSSVVKDWRFFFEQRYMDKEATISRNNFLNISIKSLPQYATYILQEYFIPYKSLATFMHNMRGLFTAYEVNIINVSARHVPADTESVLAYAPRDYCALVLYIHIPRSTKGYVHCIQWTRRLIDHALACNGTYYLPYQLLGTDAQILQAYPRLQEFFALKKQYDPHVVFSNRLYEHYAHVAH
jgi:FAD/FMN-containing dehydrogenase